VEEDILTKRFFPWAHRKESKELETGLIAVGASSSLVIGRRDGTADGRALFSLIKRASKPKRKINAASWPLLCTVFLYGFDSFHHLLSPLHIKHTILLQPKSYPCTPEICIPMGPRQKQRISSILWPSIPQELYI
jgi:hypothetical protein